MVKDRFPSIKGSDLFDASLFQNESTTKVFYSFIASLRKTIKKANATVTHEFLWYLQNTKNILRLYTQNIDDLEIEPKSKSVVQLHGTLSTVYCSKCGISTEFTDEICDTFMEGYAPDCLNCVNKEALRTALGMRPRDTGILRPNIVLYNEPHPKAEEIAMDLTDCIKSKPDLLVVMGTSLRVHGAKHLVKKLANAVHQNNGQTILINTTKLTKEWENVFDLVLQDRTDTVVRKWFKQKKVQKRIKIKKSL